MRTLAISDIHGCHTALVTLLKHIDPTATDEVIFLGDYIDRGPASREVIETLLGLKNSCSPIFLRGNHEVMMLEARRDLARSPNWESCGGSEVLLSYGAKPLEDWRVRVPGSHWEFLERTGKFFETKTDIFVHACPDPELNMSEQSDWSLYWDRFENIQRHKSGKRIVCGHTRQKSGKPANVGFAVCIDTGPASGEWLTCLDCVSGKYWQTNESGDVREGAL